MKFKIIIPLLILVLLGTVEAFLRISPSWQEKNLAESWGRLLNSPPQDPLFADEKKSGDIRIGVFGGLNVIGFTLPPKKTLAHYMEIDPPPICKTQGRNCEIKSYGRVQASANGTEELIKQKLRGDRLDIVVWLVDPQSELSDPAHVPWTSSLTLNFILAPFTQKILLRSLQSDLNVMPNLPAVVESLRDEIYKGQKDLIPVVMPGMDKPLEDQKDWEKQTAAAFFNHGFLPLRAKTLINERTRASLSLYGTGLMNEESLRALASLIRDRMNLTPQLRN